MSICCLTFSVINKRKKQHKSELVHTINPHLDDWQRPDITLFYLSTVALEIFSSWSLLTKLPVIHSLPVSCVSKCTDKELLRVLCGKTVPSLDPHLSPSVPQPASEGWLNECLRQCVHDLQDLVRMGIWDTQNVDLSTKVPPIIVLHEI